MDQGTWGGGEAARQPSNFETGGGGGANSTVTGKYTFFWRGGEGIGAYFQN